MAHLVLSLENNPIAHKKSFSENQTIIFCFSIDPMAGLCDKFKVYKHNFFDFMFANNFLTFIDYNPLRLIKGS